MRIYDHLGDTHDLSEEVEGVAEPGVLPLPGGESLARLQIEVQVQVEVLEAAPVHEDVEHVVRLLARLQCRLHPVQLSGLEELSGVETAEEPSLPKGFGRAVVQSVLHKHLEHLLVGHPDLNRLSRWAVFPVPAAANGHVASSSGLAGPQIERPWRPQESQAIGGVLSFQGELLKEWVPLLVQYKVIVLFIVRKVVNGVFSPAMLLEPMGDWVDDRVECSMDLVQFLIPFSNCPIVSFI